jgi:hypothetical protein
MKWYVSLLSVIHPLHGCMSRVPAIRQAEECIPDHRSPGLVESIYPHALAPSLNEVHAEEVMRKVELDGLDGLQQKAR